MSTFIIQFTQAQIESSERERRAYALKLNETDFKVSQVMEQTKPALD